MPLFTRAFIFQFTPTDTFVLLLLITYIEPKFSKNKCTQVWLLLMSTKNSTNKPAKFESGYTQVIVIWPCKV